MNSQSKRWGQFGLRTLLIFVTLAASQCLLICWGLGGFRVPSYVAIRKGFPKLINAFLCDLCAKKAQKLEFSQSVEMIQSFIRDLRVG